MRISRAFPGFLLVGCLASAAAAESIPNWPAPATWSPTRAAGLHTLSDVTPPLPFIGLPPCRILDTRGNGAPIQGGIFTGGSDVRNYTIPPICGVPAGVRAVSLNFTVTGPGQTAPGFLLAWPTGGAVPPVSNLNWDHVPAQVGNAAVVPTNGSGSITVNVSSPTHVVMDINGYYSSFLGTPSNFFTLVTNSPGYTMFLRNLSTSCSGECGLRQETSSNSSNSAILGLALGTTGQNFGVFGHVYSNTDNTVGVLGQAESTSGQVYGVYGKVVSTDAFGAGVHGTTSQPASNGGAFINTGANIATFLATQGGGVDYGIYTNGRVLGGSLIIAGAPKNFVSPHPLDPSKEIKYASVEAPTVDVYFRGTGTLVNGYARIEVPEHFRFTAREGTYMTTLTPIGRPISLSVESEGPEGIAVRGSGNSSFHYVIYAERAEIEGYEPIQPNVTFVPELMEKVHLLKALPRTTKALLVKNGTLNEDGTYNEATARAMGWVIPEPASQAAQSQK